MKPQDTSFSDFADAVKPTGAVNRLPQIGAAQDVLIYQVYMNGEMSNTLPDEAKEFRYTDVVIHQLTEKLGLDPTSFRDNLKVAEILSVRESWMTTVLHASSIHQQDERVPLLDHVVADYEQITNGFNHPWIQEQIQSQRERNKQLAPVLAQASHVLGQTVEDRFPSEFNKGRIVSQNESFTVQEVNQGQAVTHNNDSLDFIPSVGDDVAIMYYRGKGQVFENIQNLQISKPYLDPENQDLTISLKDKVSGAEQVVMFSGVVAFSAFVKDQGLDESLVGDGIDVLATKSQIPPKEKLPRIPVSPVREDLKTGALAIDYKEGDIQYTALFSNSAELEQLANTFGLTSQDVLIAKTVEAVARKQPENRVEVSLYQATQKAIDLSLSGVNEGVVNANKLQGKYAGKIVGETPLHIIQDAGRGMVIHEKTSLDKVPSVGQRMSVSYKDGRGSVIDRSNTNSLTR